MINLTDFPGDFTFSLFLYIVLGALNGMINQNTYNIKCILYRYV